MSAPNKRPTTLVLILLVGAFLWSLLGGIYLLKWPLWAIIPDAIISAGILLAVFGAWKKNREAYLSDQCKVNQGVADKGAQATDTPAPS